MRPCPHCGYAPCRCAIMGAGEYAIEGLLWFFGVVFGGMALLGFVGWLIHFVVLWFK